MQCILLRMKQIYKHNCLEFTRSNS